MESRAVFKLIRWFADREFREKRADKVIACRVKMKLTMRRGRAPDFLIREVKGSKYLVCVFRKDKLRVYFFGGKGEVLVADDFEGDERERIMKEISESSKTFLHFRRVNNSAP